MDRPMDRPPMGRPPMDDERSGFKAAAEIRYLTGDDIEFYETEGKLLGAKADGRDLGRVDVLWLFPIHQKDKFLSVRRRSEHPRDRETEIGIIEDLTKLRPEQRSLIEKELEKRYFVPKILKVTNVKEEFGHTYWESVTSAGARNFTTFDLGSSIIRTGEYSLILIDVDSDRYEIEDVRKIGEKALRVLDIWL
jgi:hypothetical protein